MLVLGGFARCDWHLVLLVLFIHVESQPVALKRIDRIDTADSPSNPPAFCVLALPAPIAHGCPQLHATVSRERDRPV